MRPIKLTAFFLPLAFFAGPLMAASESEVEQARQRFELFNNCEPFGLLVESLGRDAKKIGLTEESITMAAESRLRSARIYDPYTGVPYLYINVNVVGHAFSMNVEFNKRVLAEWTKERFPASTWIARSTGTHGSDATYILSSLSSKMDTFLTQYLRVNEAACESR